MTLNDMRSKTLGDILQDCDITGVKFEGNGSIDKNNRNIFSKKY